MSNGILSSSFNFIEDHPIIQLNQDGVADGTLGRVMIFQTGVFHLHTVDFGTEGIDTWVSVAEASVLLVNG